MEASGTSGMKAALNGALNMSTPDGWWKEAYKPEVGWVIGDGENYEDNAYQDMVESQAMYNILENEVIPLFYTRSSDNLPRAWIRRVKNCIKLISPQFNTHRMVGDYAQKFYIPAAAKWRYLAAEAQTKAKALATWKGNMKKAWSEFAIKDVLIQVSNGDGKAGPLTKETQLKVGSKMNIRALIKLGNINPEDVSVELYHGHVDAWGNINDGQAESMTLDQAASADGEHWFTALMPCKTSGRLGVTVRILPKHKDLVNPHELGLILWESTQ